MSEVENLSDTEPPDLIRKESEEFYKKFFPNSTRENWLDWKWQIKNRITDRKTLGQMLSLSEDEKSEAHNLPLSITPYYLSLVQPDNIDDPLRKTVVPSNEEMFVSDGEEIDPLSEEEQSPVSCIVHRYPDRALFLSTKFCSVCCRFCTRSRIIEDKANCPSDGWEEGFEYIESHKEIRDVVISGGDPLTMDNQKLDYLLSRIRAIKHVEIIRIGTKIPAVLPQRVTPELVSILKRYHPLYLSVHFTHPNELTEETKRACEMLADAGMPLGSQTVLLKGTNDNVEVLRKLFTGLLKFRVRPYYLYQCDPIAGSSHFRTPVKKGIEMIEGLRGYISGYAVPQYIIDSPGGGGKIPILPEYVQGYEDGKLILKNYKGKTYYYPDMVE